MSALWPIALHAALAVLVVVALIVLSSLLGERHREPATGEPYESGIRPTGPARPRYGAPYYLVAILFVVFDLEVAFLFAWAVTARQVGWLGFVEIAVFTGVLLAALGYLWRDGALDWGPRPERGDRPDEPGTAGAGQGGGGPSGEESSGRLGEGAGGRAGEGIGGRAGDQSVRPLAERIPWPEPGKKGSWIRVDERPADRHRDRSAPRRSDSAERGGS